jgi:LysM repeat protein
MSRRDTIIVAALINAGLLVILFVSALKNQEEDSVALSKPSSASIQTKVTAVSEPKKIVEEVAAFVDPVATSTSSFVDDLEGLTAVSVAPQPVDVQEEASTWIEVKVKKGDMLEKIARIHHTSVSEIMKVNNLFSSRLKIGQVLKIAASSKESAPKVHTTVLEAAPSKVYTVKTGDSPWTIAVKNHMKLDELLKLNNMSEEKARRLKPGDQIRIR